MATSVGDPQGIFRLPNEILLTILSTFPTTELIEFASVCHQFHSLVLRLIHHRLQLATTLDEHTLFLECGPPAAKLTTSKVFCKTLGTEHLEELSDEIQKTGGSVGQIGRLGQLFTRFHPVNKEPDFRSVPRPHPAGDIPGSNTYMTPEALAAAWKGDGNDTVSRTVSVDASCLFSQLETLVYLGKLHAGTRGLLDKYVEVCDGTIRVWRDWLARQCELKRWTDGEPIVVHQEPDSPISKGKARADSVTSSIEPKKDPNILWVNTRGEEVGIKFRVKEQKWRRENPVLFASEIEVPVSYKVELEEVVIRTAHLLLKLEESASQVVNDTGKALIFGSYLG